MNGTLIKAKDFSWYANFNISHNKDKILSLPASKVGEKGGFTESSRWYKIGGSLYNAFYVEYAGVNEQGEALFWADEDLYGTTNATNTPGKKHSFKVTNPNGATKYEQGSLLPKVYGGFGTGIDFKGIDVSVTFDYQLGGQIYDSRYKTLMGSISSATDAGKTVHKDILKSWTPNNTSSDIPRYQYLDQYTNATSNRWLTSASYLNFQSFTVGYTVPNRYLKNLGLSKLRVYASGENLYFWSARKGLDPRYSYSATESLTVYSPVRTVMGGIQVSF